MILNSQMRWERNPEEEVEGSSIHSDSYLLLTIPDGTVSGVDVLPALAAAKTFWGLLNSRENEGWEEVGMYGMFWCVRGGTWRGGGCSCTSLERRGHWHRGAAESEHGFDRRVWEE